MVKVGCIFKLIVVMITLIEMTNLMWKTAGATVVIVICGTIMIMINIISRCKSCLLIKLLVMTRNKLRFIILHVIFFFANIIIAIKTSILANIVRILFSFLYYCCYFLHIKIVLVDVCRQRLSKCFW